ncbi:tetratricopeptide repeat protein [Thiomicrorhabdus lithotrophica]|uniref:Tetratricopeptide repeat protein n=1 Tax=Thiomicrorhabdus lithotrophica TaxID=2949997 RepID=A0ABY8CBR1_9GAMM|nr:tetratricopeptide repeat protein [Thiomicrorhabdus lithotrophica]WEJ62115.1 tetratricopeptide repeat protein [Thiomicrorhabdus lithotrophica]
MSVLLDALKKAAEDKKKADNLVADTDADQDSRSSESFSGSQDNSNLDFKLAVPDEDNSSIESSEANANENGNALIANDEIKVSPKEELPSFSLNTSEETVSDVDVNSELDFQIKLQPEDTLNTQNESETSNNDLESLINSLDIEDNVTVDKVGLEPFEVSSTNVLSGLSAEQKTQSGLESANPKTTIKSEETNTTDDFNWSMDDLPGYENSSQSNDDTSQKAKSLSQNPILINGENTPPKIKKKYATSTRIIVSLVVVLLFIGIGFYGMLYYQEQNEDLEFSMRKYNLSKMQFTQPKSDHEVNTVLQESIEDNSALNIVTDKVMSIGSTIKDAVTTQLNDDSDKPQTLQDSSSQVAKLTNTEDALSSQLPAKNLSNSSIQRPKKIQNKAIRDTKYNSSKKPTEKLANTPLYSTDAMVSISTARSSLSKAYSAYESGDFQQANQMFTDALEKEPRNINALLGLGGIAVAQSDNYSALNYYQKVLDVEPNNIYAFESIANLSGKMLLNKSWENELFEMSQKYPSSAVLQYAKGNVFAKESDWLAAQESYFNAYALDSVNPDYMVNLAISYDHLGKYELAAQYYTQALGFAPGSNVSFDKKQVRDRLVSLRQFISQGH